MATFLTELLVEGKVTGSFIITHSIENKLTPKALLLNTGRCWNCYRGFAGRASGMCSTPKLSRSATEDKTAFQTELW